MNPRERVLAGILIAFILLAGGGGLGYMFYLKPLKERETRLAALRDEVEKKRAEVQQVQRDLPKLELWKNLSLPADPDLALREYERFLSQMLRESGFEPTKTTIKPQRAAEVRSSPSAQAKGPGYSRLTFNVQTTAALGKVVRFLERFYDTALLHQVRGLTLTYTVDSAKTGDLRVDLTIEALVLPAPETRARPAAYAVAGTAAWAARFGKAVPPGGPAREPGDYLAVADHNIFLGPPPPPAEVAVDRTQLTNFILLTGITQGPNDAEASFNYLYNGKRPRVWQEPGYDTFPILEDSRGRVVVEGAVLGMDERDLYFRVQLAVPRESGRFRSRDQDRWSRPDDKTLEMLVQKQAVDVDEVERVYQIGRPYWEQLDREEVVDVRGADFTFRWNLVSGQVLSSDDRTVTVLVHEKYCAYTSTSGSEGRFRRRTEPHQGYFAWHVGDNLDKAMASPLGEEQVKKLQKAATASPPPGPADEARR